MPGMMIDLLDIYGLVWAEGVEATISAAIRCGYGRWRFSSEKGEKELFGTSASLGRARLGVFSLSPG